MNGPSRTVLPHGRRRGRLFTPESANRALTLVRRIVADVVTEYRRLMELQARREELAQGRGAQAARELETALAIEATVRRLNALAEELAQIGCELKDWSEGLVDFPCLCQGRRVWLCWKLGEPRVEYWHEYSAGFAGRRPIDADFEARCTS